MILSTVLETKKCFFYNKENTSNIKRAGDEFFFFQEKIFHINGGKKNLFTSVAEPDFHNFYLFHP